MASIVCLYMVSSCRCMLSNSQTKNGLASTSNSDELDAVLFLVLPWNVSCPKVLNFRLVIHKQRSLTFSSGHPVCSLHIKFSLFYQPCHVHSWATTLLERVWQRLRVGVACWGCRNELFFICNHGHISLTFRFTLHEKKLFIWCLAAKSKKLGLPQILYEFPQCRTAFCSGRVLSCTKLRDQSFTWWHLWSGGRWTNLFLFLFFFFSPLKSFSPPYSH